MESGALNLMVSLNGRDFALSRFPPNMHLESQVGALRTTFRAVLSRTDFPGRIGLYRP
jgi:hypothetical protein